MKEENTKDLAEFREVFSDKLTNFRNELLMEITMQYREEITKNRTATEDELKKLCKSIKTELHNTVAIEGKVVPKIPDEQAKMTGKSRYLGAYVQKQFDEISAKFDKLNSKLKKHDNQFKDQSQKALEANDELNEKIVINGRKIKNLIDELNTVKE